MGAAAEVWLISKRMQTKPAGLPTFGSFPHPICYWVAAWDHRKSIASRSTGCPTSIHAMTRAAVAYTSRMNATCWFRSSISSWLMQTTSIQSVYGSVSDQRYLRALPRFEVTDSMLPLQNNSDRCEASPQVYESAFQLTLSSKDTTSSVH